MEKNNLPNLEVSESQSFDTSKYVGMKTKIEKMTINEGSDGTYLKVITEDLGDGIRASRLFGLKSDGNGNISISNKSKLFEFMQNKKVDDYRKLIGVDVVVIDETRNNQNWLIFS